MTGVDWSKVRPKAGDHLCSIHGVIAPASGLVPHCAEPDGGRLCLRIALEAVADRGRLVFRWPQPAACPAGHPLAPATVSITWVGCRCTPAGGHRRWICVACPHGAPAQMWPPTCPLVLEQSR